MTPRQKINAAKLVFIYFSLMDARDTIRIRVSKAALREAIDDMRDLEDPEYGSVELSEDGSCCIYFVT